MMFLSVFVFTHKPPLVHSIPDDYVVEHAFPIIHGFSISMSQPRQATIDLSSPPAGSTFTLNQPRTGMSIGSSALPVWALPCPRSARMAAVVRASSVMRLSE